jgi:hypothetical protein
MVNASENNFTPLLVGTRGKWTNCPLVNIIKRMMARDTWRVKASERWEHCAAYNLKRSFWQRYERRPFVSNKVTE